MNKTPLNSCVCGTPGTIWAPLGAQYRAPLVKSEFFFFVYFLDISATERAQWIPLLFYNAGPQGYL